MPDSAEQRLIVSLEARTSKLEKDFARARKVANDNMAGMERRAKQYADNTERALGKTFDNIAGKMERAFAPFLRGGAVFAAVGGAAIAVKQIADSVAEVDREARKAGVSAKVWQQWSYIATATGATIDGVTDALKELNIRGDEFAKTGKGSAQDAFATLGYTAEEVGRKLADPNRFLDEIIGKLQRLDRAAQTRALDELFGGTGAEQLAKVIGLSVSEIQKLRNEAATFTDEQIEAAKKLDREFDTLWRNFTLYAKKAAIEGVSAAQNVYRALSGEFLPGYQAMQDAKAEAAARANDPARQLADLRARRDRILKEIADAEAAPDWFGKAQEIRVLKGHLQAVEDEIIALGGGSDKLKAALKELSDMTQRAGGTFDNTAISAGNFKSALTELKNLVPELKNELDQLGTMDGIDAAFRKAAGSARTMSEVMGAADIANRARSMARYGRHDNMLDLIGAAEGTDRGRGYNETLGYGAFTGGAVNLTGMTLNQVRDLQRAMLAHPANTYNSSAVGRYQITGRTLQSLIDELGLSGDRLFDEGTQDELARALLRRRGDDPAALRNEWQGLRNVDDATIRNAYSGTPVAAQQLPPTDAQQRQTDLLRQQDEARKTLNATIDQGLARARLEQQISGMSAEQQRVELALFDYVQEAKRAGITLTDEEIRRMREKLTLTAQLDTENKKAAQSQDALAQAGEFFGRQFTSALSGLLTGTTSLNDAVRSLINSLIDATLQAALLGEGPLAALFGTAGGGGLFGAIFGFAEGGYTGDGRKHQPAGIVHKGEYVMSKRATARLGVANLEALHQGALKGFDRGGYVGSAPAVRRLHVPANANAGPPAITVNAPITVEGSAGTPEQNADLAKQMSRQLEATMRGVVADELRRQMRPGNMGGRR